MSKYRKQRAESVGWGEGVVPPQGHASSNVGGKPNDDYYAAILWLPDPSTPTGYSIHAVDYQKDEEPPRSLGFKRSAT